MGFDQLHYEHAMYEFYNNFDLAPGPLISAPDAQYGVLFFARKYHYLKETPTVYSHDERLTLPVQ